MNESGDTCQMATVPDVPTTDYLRGWDVLEAKLEAGIRPLVVEGPEADGTIFDSLYREKVLGHPTNLAPQPARQDLRKLTCIICGQPSSPHRAPHAAVISIPPRYLAVAT